MILIGRYLSPFVRRVATTLEFYGLDFEHQPLQHTGDDAPVLRQKNPLGRVPALILDDDEVLVDSTVITDNLDRLVGPERALTPATGKLRDRVMSLTAIATGAADKVIATVYEVRFRPEEKRYPEWVERCAEQARGGFNYLDSHLVGQWLAGDSMTQADVTGAIVWQFTGTANPELKASIDAPNLDRLVDRMMQLPAYAKTLPS